MAMCTMPLLIKVEMKKQNYIALLEEASKRYQKNYLSDYYLFDGKYFTLDTCFMDDVSIRDEAAMVANYAEPTDNCVGMIFSKGCSFSFAELYFKDGKCSTVENEIGNNASEATYREFKKGFLEKIPALTSSGHFKDDVTKTVLSVDITYQEYKCIGIGMDEFMEIFKKHDAGTVHIDRDMGCVSIQVENNASVKKEPEDIIAEYFGCDKAYIFCSDTDQQFPYPVMIMLYNLSNKAQA